MSKKKTEHQPEAPTDPPLATTEAVQSAVNQEPESEPIGDGTKPEPPVEKQKRKKRTAMEVFADTKQEKQNKVANTAQDILNAQAAHEAAKVDLEKFLADWKASLGL